MEHFTEEEFLGCYADLHSALKVRLDFLRLTLGVPITLSNDPAGFSRHLGFTALSHHNVDKYIYLQAVDGYIPDTVSFREFYEAAQTAGFTGIGFYTGWPSGRRGFHVDIREDATPANPATWGARWDDVNEKNVYDVNIFDLIVGEEG